MALTNFILTVAAVGCGFFILTRDVKQAGAMLRRNARHFKKWIEEPVDSTSSKAAEALKPKELPKQDIPKDN